MPYNRQAKSYAPETVPQVPKAVEQGLKKLIARKGDFNSVLPGASLVGLGTSLQTSGGILQSAISEDVQNQVNFKINQARKKADAANISSLARVSKQAVSAGKSIARVKNTQSNLVSSMSK